MLGSGIGHAQIAPPVGFEPFDAVGPETGAIGAGLSDLILTDLAMLDDELRYKDCSLTVVAWGKDRAAIEQEIALQKTDAFDPDTRITPTLIDPGVIVRGSVEASSTSITWSVRAENATSGEIMWTDAGTAGPNDILQVSGGIARRLAESLCPERPSTRHLAPRARTYVGTVSLEGAGDGISFTAAGAVAFEESGPDTDSFVALEGRLGVRFSADDCTPFEGTLPLFGELYLNAPRKGQHGIALFSEAFPVTCNGVSLEMALLSMIAPCEPGITNADETQLEGSASCGSIDYKWELRLQ